MCIHIAIISHLPSSFVTSTNCGKRECRDDRRETNEYYRGGRYQPSNYSEDMRNANLSQSSSTAYLQPSDIYAVYLTWPWMSNGPLNDCSYSTQGITYRSKKLFAHDSVADCCHVGVWLDTSYEHRWHIDDITGTDYYMLSSKYNRILVATMTALTDYVPSTATCCVFPESNGFSPPPPPPPP